MIRKLQNQVDLAESKVQTTHKQYESSEQFSQKKERDIQELQKARDLNQKLIV